MATKRVKKPEPSLQEVAESILVSLIDGDGAVSQAFQECSSRLVELSAQLDAGEPAPGAARECLQGLTNLAALVRAEWMRLDDAELRDWSQRQTKSERSAS